MRWKLPKKHVLGAVSVLFMAFIASWPLFRADVARSHDLTTAGDVGTKEKMMRSQAPDSIVANYFHRTYRCVRCITMEAYILAVIHLKHSAELEAGTLRWHTIDYEDPENSFYAEKHDFDGPALVLSHWKDGKETNWTDLKEIWALLDTPGVLVGWIDRNIEACLEGECDHAGPEDG